MTLAQLITEINNNITANGNEEITGNILNGVLLDMVGQINDLVGKLEDLATDDDDSIVEAINSLKQEIDNIVMNDSLVGLADPNDTSPVGFDGTVGTIYIQLLQVGSNIVPQSYWIWTSIPSIGWLNLTKDDEFELVRVSTYGDLPPQGQTNRFYFVEDTGNTYVWSTNIQPNDYVQVGGVVEGEYISPTVFEVGGVPVVPDGGNLYLDTVSGKYYRWDGNYFIGINEDTGDFEGIATDNSGGINFTGDGTTGDPLQASVDYSGIPDGNIPLVKLGELTDSDLYGEAGGVYLDGKLRADGIIGKSVTANISGSYAIDFDDIAEHYILTMTDNSSITFSNLITANETAVITLTVSGNYSMTLPSWIKASPNNDDYSTTELNEIVINIKRGGVTPLGYYTLTNYPI